MDEMRFPAIPGPAFGVALGLLLVACGGEGTQSRPNTAVNAGASAGGDARANAAFNKPPGPDRKRPWYQPPGPIAGKWKTSAYPPDMIVEVTVTGKNAVGRVVVAGEGAKRHYTEGEQILTLQVDDFGQWVGQLKKKYLSASEKMEPIRFVASDNVLDAIMTSDEAFKRMTRVE
jgi:hypothetical protein